MNGGGAGTLFIWPYLSLVSDRIESRESGETRKKGKEGKGSAREGGSSEGHGLREKVATAAAAANCCFGGQWYDVVFRKSFFFFNKFLTKCELSYNRINIFTFLKTPLQSNLAQSRFLPLQRRTERYEVPSSFKDPEACHRNV